VAISADKISQHIAIVQNFWTEHGDAFDNVSQKAIVLAGPPGAGKSSTLASLIPEFFGSEPFVVIDGDHVKDVLLRQEIASGRYASDFLPLVREYEEQGAMFFPNDFSGLVHHESMVVHGDLVDDSIDRGANIIIDGTLSWYPYGESIFESLRAAGYKTQLLADVEAARHEAEAHAYARWRYDYDAAIAARSIVDSEPMGGRVVPEVAYNSIFGRPDGISKSLINARRLATNFSVSLKVFFPSKSEKRAELVFDSEVGTVVQRDSTGKSFGRCSVCGHAIWSERSLQLGMGSGCARKLTAS
jgi:adenylate kinase family enzyme